MFMLGVFVIVSSAAGASIVAVPKAFTVNENNNMVNKIVNNFIV